MRSRLLACLTVALITTVIPIEAQTASELAQALVKGAAAAATGDLVLKRLHDTSEDVRKQVTSDWSEALGLTTGQKFDGPINQLRLEMLPGNFSELYAAGTLQMDRARDYGACVRQISTDSFAKWMSALYAIPGTTIDRVRVALEVVRLPAACRAGRLDQALAGGFLNRLSSLPGDSVIAWSGAQGAGNMDPGRAALNLIAVDQLFVSNKFQPQLFRAALPIARRDLEAARSNK